MTDDKRKYKIGQWYPWTGAVRPMYYSAEVRVMDAQGFTFEAKAKDVNWGGGIVAFCVTSYPVEVREERWDIVAKWLGGEQGALLKSATCTYHDGELVKVVWEKPNE